MNEDKVFRNVARLREPGRLSLLEVERVVDLCLRDGTARTVLDIGTGTGIFAEAFSGRGLEATGVDVQETMIEAARTLVPGARFAKGDSTDLPFPAGSFDLCFLGLVLHESDDPARVLAEAHRVCRVQTAILEWPYAEHEEGPPLRHRIKEEAVRRTAAAAGFSQFTIIPLKHLVLYLMDKEEPSAN